MITGQVCKTCASPMVPNDAGVARCTHCDIAGCPGCGVCRTTAAGTARATLEFRAMRTPTQSWLRAH